MDQISAGELVSFLSFVDGNDCGRFPEAKHVIYDQDHLKRKKSYCWAEERRWVRSGNAT